MKADSFFYSPTLDREVKESEWACFLKQYPPEKTVLEYKGFRYNVYGVCLNPCKHEFTQIQNLMLTIETQETINGYFSRYGFHVNIADYFGGTGGGTYTDGPFYTTEKEAILYSIKTLRNYIAKYKDHPELVKKLDKLIIEQSQLKLF